MKFFLKILFYNFNTVIKLFFTIVYIRIICLRWKFDDHPLVEYPLQLYFCIPVCGRQKNKIKMKNKEGRRFNVIY